MLGGPLAPTIFYLPNDQHMAFVQRQQQQQQQINKAYMHIRAMPPIAGYVGQPQTIPSLVGAVPCAKSMRQLQLSNARRHYPPFASVPYGDERNVMSARTRHHINQVPPLKMPTTDFRTAPVASTRPPLTARV